MERPPAAFAAPLLPNAHRPGAQLAAAPSAHTHTHTHHTARAQRTHTRGSAADTHGQPFVFITSPHPTILRTSLYSAPHYTLHPTMRCTSLYSAPHYTPHLTILCTSLRAAPHYTLHPTLRCTSLYAAPHYTPHLTDMKHAAEQRHRHDEPRSRCSLWDRQNLDGAHQSPYRSCATKPPPGQLGPTHTGPELSWRPPPVHTHTHTSHSTSAAHAHTRLRCKLSTPELRKQSRRA
jgi:hypothetical protein